MASFLLIACGSGGDTSPQVDEPAAEEAASDSPTDSSNVSEDVIADLRSSEALSDGLLTELSPDTQLCVLRGITEDAQLTDSVLNATEADPQAQVKLTKILLGCDPGVLRSVLADLTGDNSFDAMADDELECVVTALSDEEGVLEDLLNGDGVKVASMLARCAPTLMASSLASELGVTADQAECLLSSDVNVIELIASGAPETDEEFAAWFEQLTQIAIDCGIDDGALSSASTYSSYDEAELAVLRDDCATGDMAACDDLWVYSPPDSVDEEFGATCGGRTDGSMPGTCDVEIDEVDYRSMCADGDMSACDTLFFYSEVGSEDEDFGATCGGTTDGSTAGYCSESSDE